MRKTIHVITTAAILTFAALPTYAAMYIKVSGVDGRATAAGKEKWIELESIQFLTAPGAAAQLKDAKLSCRKAGGGDATTKEPVERLCASSAAVPTVVVDADGDRHELRNVVFSRCQAVGGETKFSFTFAGCTTHGTTAPDHTVGGGTLAAPQSGSAAKTYDHSTGGGTIANAAPGTAADPTKYSHSLGGGSYATNAKLTGATSAPVAVQVESLTLNGTGATLTLVKEGRGDDVILILPTTLPSLVVELTTGQKWTFYEVKLENIMISSATARAAGARPTQAMSLNFTKVDGPRTGFQAAR
jgi:hypothetical protein